LEATVYGFNLPCHMQVPYPVGGSVKASEITGSMPTPQSKGNVTAGVQASSDATPDDVTAVASGRLNRSQSSRPQSPRAMSSEEEAKLIARAESLIEQFDFANARLFLANAWEKRSARAAFMMAETYDGQILRSLQAYGVRGDAQRSALRRRANERKRCNRMRTSTRVWQEKTAAGRRAACEARFEIRERHANILACGITRTYLKIASGRGRAISVG
jgi:hypothetical protein